MTAGKRKARLHRLSVLYVRSPIYFITACTYNRAELLATPAIHESFIRFAQNGADHGAWVGRYVLMPDHLHAFVATDDERITLARWGKSLKNILSKVLRLSCVAAPHWEKTFFDHVMRGSESYSAKWEYVRNNPVRAGFVQNADDWPFAGEIFPLAFRRD